MKKHLLIWIAAFALLIINTSAYGQGFIGETELEIRGDFKDNPAAEFHINYVDKDRVVTVVDNSVQMSFMFNNKGVCYWSLMYIYDPKVLDTVVKGLDTRTVVITKGEAWVSIHKGYKVHVKIGYSTKMKATNLMFSSDELKFGSIHRKQSTSVAKHKKQQDLNKMNLGELLGSMPTTPIPNDGNSAVLTPYKGTESYGRFNPAIDKRKP